MKRLRVWYGWARQNKIRKKEAISVIFENEQGDSDRKQLFIKRMQDTVFVRFQSEEEAKDAEGINRVFTEYSLFMDNKAICGSLSQALTINHQKDRNHVGEDVRDKIMDALRSAYLRSHPKYKEPYVQLNFLFEQ